MKEIQKIITVFLTEDGREYKTRIEAQIWEVYVLYKDWYHDTPLLDNRGVVVDFRDLLAWLLQHEKTLLRFMGRSESVEF